MNIAIVGCGYVAAFYGKTLTNYPELSLVGAYDINPANLATFTRHWPARSYRSLEELIEDPNVELVVNLTNPMSHFEVTKVCLEANKHVYTEKPMAMTTEDAKTLTRIAETKELLLCSAPCSVLSETAQTLWKAIREGSVGKVRLVYANFDDGILASDQAPWTWRNELGVPWPAKDEFEVGCTFEHAGYVLTWLTSFFGPAEGVTSFASCQVQDKGVQVARMAPDFVVGCVEFPENVVARVTCGLVAPRDRSMTVTGDDGVLYVGDVRDDAGPVMVRPSQRGPWQSRLHRRTRWLNRWLEGRLAWADGAALFQREYPLVRRPRGRFVAPDKSVDFLRGPAEMAEAEREERPSRLGADFSTHIVEIVEALQHPERFGGGRTELTTTFSPLPPLDWAR